ncbi:MAG: CoA ester lyase [Ramlibacter sp.]|nr:CoA ester lyase [Ramlibacter sp.]
MIRSLLFVPGDSPRKFDKAMACSADALILDLEDSVAQASKEAAGATVLGLLGQPRGDKKIFVRVNALDTGMLLRDLAAVMAGRPDGVMLPKCGGPQDVIQLGHYLDAFEASLGLAPGVTAIIPVATETPQAVLALKGYEACGPRLWGLLWGAEDLSCAIGATTNRSPDGQYRSPFRLTRDLCLMAATAAGVVPIDTVYTDFRDLEGLALETTQGRIDGFAAKAAIHPAQCDTINAAFHPSEQELAWANAVLKALREGPSGGVASLDGKMIDRPHEVQARRILGLA